MWSVVLPSACWQYFVPLGSRPPAKFPPHLLNSFSATLGVKSPKSVYVQQPKVVFCLHFFIDGFESA